MAKQRKHEEQLAAYHRRNPNLRTLVREHIRQLRADHFLDDKLALLDPLVRLGFLGLWTQADKYGRFEWNAKVLKVKVLPFDNCDFEAILTTLAEHKRISQYTGTDGELYGQIAKWDQFQGISHNEEKSKFKYPEPAGQSASNVPEHSRTNKLPDGDGDVDVDGDVAVDGDSTGYGAKPHEVKETDINQQQHQQPKTPNPAAVDADGLQSFIPNTSGRLAASPNPSAEPLSDSDIWKMYQRAWKEQTCGIPLDSNRSTVAHRKAAADFYRQHGWRALIAFKQWIDTLPKDGPDSYGEETLAWPLNSFVLADTDSLLAHVADLDDSLEKVSDCLKTDVLEFVVGLESEEKRILDVDDIYVLSGLSEFVKYDVTLANVVGRWWKRINWDEEERSPAEMLKVFLREEQFKLQCVIVDLNDEARQKAIHASEAADEVKA